jgi:glycosyltransferase involved in cell wall biosynthesis
MLAESMVSPSNSLAKILIREWKLDSYKVSVIPYPFIAPEPLLSIPINITTTKFITFIGKLNVQKGIVILVEVIKQIAQKYPDVYFRLIGNDSYYSNAKSQMSDYIVNSLKGFEKNYTIKGGLSYHEILFELSKSDICVFPSIWENFGIVCLEAMSAGRAIVASKNGGWLEMLTNDSGILVDPLNKQQIVTAISQLLDSPQSRVNYGITARETLLNNFNQKAFTILENHYYKLINSDT